MKQQKAVEEKKEDQSVIEIRLEEPVGSYIGVSLIMDKKPLSENELEGEALLSALASRAKGFDPDLFIGDEKVSFSKSGMRDVFKRYPQWAEAAKKALGVE